MKGFSVSLAIGKMQIKTTTRQCHTPVRTGQLKNRVNTRGWQGRRETALLIHCCREHKMGTATWEKFCSFLKNKQTKKLNMQLPRNSANTLLGFCPREMKTYVHTRTCTRVFKPALPVYQSPLAAAIYYQKQWLKATQIYSFTVLEARSLTLILWD